MRERQVSRVCERMGDFLTAKTPRLFHRGTTAILGAVYVRFAVDAIDDDSQVRGGILQAAYSLRDDEDLLEDDREALEALLSWFASQLNTPDRFTRTSSKGYYRRAPKGISWLKDTAKEHIEKMREVGEILARHGHRVKMLKESRPGYLVYEDEFQVVAEPFADSTT